MWSYYNLNTSFNGMHANTDHWRLRRQHSDGFSDDKFQKATIAIALATDIRNNPNRVLLNSTIYSQVEAFWESLDTWYQLLYILIILHVCSDFMPLYFRLYFIFEKPIHVCKLSKIIPGAMLRTPKKAPEVGIYLFF